MANTGVSRRPGKGKGKARRLDRLINIATVVAVLLLIAVIALWRIPSQYQILMPASAQSVTPMIAVNGHPPRSGSTGEFLMTFVSEPDSNLLEEILARLDPDATIVPLPPSYSATADHAASVQMMLSSVQTAELVAMCQLGYPDLCHGGVLVQNVASWSKAMGLLKVNDIVVALNGRPVKTSIALRDAMKGIQPGATVRLSVLRGAGSVTVPVRAMRSPQAPHGTVIGMSIADAGPVQLPPRLPYAIKIDPGQIGGPSAGLMFTLGIINRIGSSDLTHGLKIAGTGEIAIDGSVGPIGGIKQKVIGAQWAHARYFLTPCAGGNYTDARKIVGKAMTLVPVNNLSDALTFLRSLGTNGTLKAAFSYATCPPSG
jgi:PDZ domain-containing protein